MYRTSGRSKSNDEDEEAKHIEVDDNIDKVLMPKIDNLICWEIYSYIYSLDYVLIMITNKKMAEFEINLFGI